MKSQDNLKEVYMEDSHFKHDDNPDLGHPGKLMACFIDGNVRPMLISLR